MTIKKHTINSALSLADFIGLITHIWREKKNVTVSIHPQQRSLTQNSAIHKYFELLAGKLNDKGLDMKAVLSPGIDIPWTSELVKELLWKRVQLAMFDIESTSKLSRQQVSQVYDVLHRKLAADHDVNIQFPSKEREKKGAK